jgi:hypothetical protein
MEVIERSMDEAGAVHVMLEWLKVCNTKAMEVIGSAMLGLFSRGSFPAASLNLKINYIFLNLCSSICFSAAIDNLIINNILFVNYQLQVFLC